MSRTARGAIRSVPGADRALQRVDRALRWRIEEAVEPLRRQLADLEKVGADAGAALSEVRRMAAQLAAAEVRLADMAQRLARPGSPGDPDRDQGEAVRLIDEIRQEHRQIRSRMTAISWYEDRLRQAEQRIGALEGTGQ